MYIADLHIHSRYSRATSRDCTPEYLDLWARRKGIGLIGTGDFTHPAWREELEEKLANINAQLEPYQKEINRIQNSDLPAEEKQAQLRAITDDETYRQLVSDQATTRMELTAFQLDPSNQNSEDLEKLLADAGLDVSQVDTALTEMINSLNALQNSIDALQELSRQLQEQAIQLD